MAPVLAYHSFTPRASPELTKRHRTKQTAALPDRESMDGGHRRANPGRCDHAPVGNLPHADGVGPLRYALGERRAGVDGDRLDARERQQRGSRIARSTSPSSIVQETSTTR